MRPRSGRRCGRRSARAGVAGASVFCHRDYHAENLIWLPGRKGVARVGMLDFQDAVRAHPAWDLSMLLHDGRRDVSPGREQAVLARYLAARPEVDAVRFLADYHALGALNVSRILFIFARQVAGFGRPQLRAVHAAHVALPGPLPGRSGAGRPERLVRHA